jgi:hypothetical protein
MSALKVPGGHGIHGLPSDPKKPGEHLQLEIEELPEGDSELLGQGRHVPEKKKPSPEVVE